jgi:hypothetical protein
MTGACAGPPTHSMLPRLGQVHLDSRILRRWQPVVDDIDGERVACSNPEVVSWLRAPFFFSLFTFPMGANPSLVFHSSCIPGPVLPILSQSAPESINQITLIFQLRLITPSWTGHAVHKCTGNLVLKLSHLTAHNSGGPCMVSS